MRYCMHAYITCAHVQMCTFHCVSILSTHMLTHAYANKHNAHSQESQKMDRFVIYDSLYSNLCNVLVDAAYHDQTEGLAGSCQVREMML